MSLYSYYLNNAFLFYSESRDGVYGWHSGKSACLRGQGLNPRPGVIMLVEFVFGSHPCSEGFPLGFSVFHPPHKPTLLNSNLIGKQRATGLSVVRLLCATLMKQCQSMYLYILPEASDLIGKEIPKSYLDLLKPGFLINCNGS